MFLFFLISSKPSLRNHDGWCLQLPHSTWPTFQSRENNCGILLEKRAMWNSACLGKEIVCGPWKEILSVYCKDNYKWTWVDGEWKVFSLAFLSINKTWKSSPKGRMLFSSITCKMKCWLHSFFLLSLHVDLTLVMVIIFITTQVSAYVSQPVSAEMKGHSHRWWHYPNRNILGTHELIIFTFKPLLSHGFWVLFQNEGWMGGREGGRKERREGGAETCYLSLVFSDSLIPPSPTLCNSLTRMQCTDSFAIF